MRINRFVIRRSGGGKITRRYRHCCGPVHAEAPPIHAQAPPTHAGGPLTTDFDNARNSREKRTLGTNASCGHEAAEGLGVPAVLTAGKTSSCEKRTGFQICRPIRTNKGAKRTVRAQRRQAGPASDAVAASHHGRAASAPRQPRRPTTRGPEDPKRSSPGRTPPTHTIAGFFKFLTLRTLMIGGPLTC
jgi:hypothetical protein